MKILFLVNHYNTLRVFRKELLIKLNELGHEVIVSTPFDTKENMDILRSFGCKLIETDFDRRGTNPIKDIKLYFTYKKLIKNVKPDIVLTYTVKPNLYGIKAAGDLKIPCYATVTGLGSAFQGEGISKKILTLLYKWSLHNATKVFFQNEGNRNALTELGIVKKENTIITPGSGVNTEDFKFTEYPKYTGTLNFLFIGRIMKEKGIDELFESIERLNKENPNNKTIFSFIGWYEDNYKDKVEELQKKGYIKYYGFQSDVRPYIEKAHCIVIPSYHEGMNNSLLEAESMGRPVITTNIYGCKEAVINEETGFLCEPKSADSLYEKLKQFIDLPYNEKEKMGLNAREYMVNKFDKKIVVDMYLKEIN